MADERGRLRRQLRAARSRVAAPARQAAAVAVVRQLQRNAVFRRSRRIALYLATGAELSTWPLAQACSDAGKQLFLPCVRGSRMHFATWSPCQPLRAGAFGIPEPGYRAVPAWRADLDVVIVPLLGFDAHGNRLGQGGGYYDRTFAAYRYRSWRHPRLFGIAYDVQRCAVLAAMPWDVRLDGVFTERARYP